MADVVDATGIHPSLSSLAVEMARLQPLPGNPNRGDVAAVARSYNVFGQRKPIVARRTGEDAKDRPVGIVLAGNTQLAAALSLGWPAIAVVWTDDDELTAKAFALADNRTAELSGTDEDALAAMLAEVSTDAALLAAASYSDDDLAVLLNAVEQRGGDSDPDDAPGTPAEPVSKVGDVWLLGDSRLAVGDCTDRDVLAAAVGGGRLDCMWTDPPYGVDYVGKTADAMVIANDTAEGLPALLADCFREAGKVLRPGAPVYVAHPPGPSSFEFLVAFRDAGWRWRQTLVWVKDSMVLGHSDYHYRHELILFGYTSGAKGRRGRGGSGWFGDNSQTSVFEVARPKASREHPTAKPVDLVAVHLDNSCPPGGRVLDPFAGSGSTLVAAWRSGRTAALVELSPGYADVICRRYQSHTSDVPRREDGSEVDFTVAV